ncbi:EF-hand domain-containing protein [Brevundimonas sp. VNH65]|uniref:EF-hand domain-containing protein n=1 Tax=Brevundimonas sp. VNH65 TaxID=3400917 RepID=UPI003C1234B8
MTRSLMFGGLAAVSLSLAAGASPAQTPTPPATHPVPARMDVAGRAAPIAKADFVQRRMARLTAMDADADGVVTAAERQAARQTQRAAAAQRRFDRLDADKNGMISRDEFQALGERPSAGRHRAARPHAARSARMSAGEARAERNVDLAEARARTEAAFDRLDADRDGTVTAAERRETRSALRERVKARRDARRSARQAPSPSTPASE